MTPATTPMPAFGAFLRGARLGAGMTQAQAADALQVSVSTYRRVERGRMELTSRELATLAERFGLTLPEVEGARDALRTLEGALVEGSRIEARDTREVA